MEKEDEKRLSEIKKQIKNLRAQSDEFGCSIEDQIWIDEMIKDLKAERNEINAKY